MQFPKGKATRNKSTHKRPSHCRKDHHVNRNKKTATRAHKGSKKTQKPRFTQEALWDLELRTYQRLCKAVNTPFANEMYEKTLCGDWLGIANAPMPDTSSDSFPDDYLIQQVLRKNPRLPLGKDGGAAKRRDTAIRKFHESEAVCHETNQLLSLCAGDYATPQQACLAIKPAVLAKIRTTIKDILGPLTKAKLDYVEEKSRFGPGATYHCSSKDLTMNKKLRSIMGLTPSLYSFVGCLEPHGWMQTTSGYGLTAGSKAATVPKDALTDRFIAIEPGLNMFWQLGIGALIRRQLKRFGIDLRHQADKNRLRVRFAQATSLATIDLSSASDTIARRLIAFLLPPEWNHLLALFRSPKMQVDGDWLTLEKISSMGNGFTFELETLVFYAIAKAFDDDPYVFGDDIIVRQDVASAVVRTLNVFGFSVNGKKTFLAGSFFESCGSDYWRGLNVRPFYFKKDVHEDLTSAVIRMANAIRRYAHRRNIGRGCDDRFLPVWLYLVKRCPIANATAIPEGYGDVGIVRNFDEATPSVLRNFHQGFTARAYGGRPRSVNVTYTVEGLFGSLTSVSGSNSGRPIIKTDWRGNLEAQQFGLATGRLKWLGVPYLGHWMTAGPTASLSSQTVRGCIEKPKARTMPVFDWHELGPWQ